GARVDLLVIPPERWGTALLIGAAGMVAGAVSMATGEYLGVRSRIELYERQIALEEEELRLYPDDEAEELAMIFEARGLEREAARDLGKRLISEPARALDVLTREELGLNPDDLGSPWASALASLLCFGGGALVPLLPLALLPALGLGSGPALLGAVALSGVALFVSGAATSLFTGRSGVRSGLRLASVGLALSGVLYGLGLAVRASLGG
ncbi:MAG: VIT1/CCC1 transporter family protein, partial [Acidobacteria bacterium]|nr:VIT1/CCC1 transporter family protein [Acidobacteriota bacterium]